MVLYVIASHNPWMPYPLSFSIRYTLCALKLILLSYIIVILAQLFSY